MNKENKNLIQKVSIRTRNLKQNKEKRWRIEPEPAIKIKEECYKRLL